MPQRIQNARRVGSVENRAIPWLYPTDLVSATLRGAQACRMRSLMRIWEKVAKDCKL